MSEQETPATTGEYQTAVKRAHRAVSTAEGTVGKRQHAAGIAVREAENAGAITFDRTVPPGAPEGCMTRADLARTFGGSPTVWSKYRAIGRLDSLGINPSHADYPFAAKSALTAWMTEALETGDPARVVKAIADHRPGSQSGSGGATDGLTKSPAKKATTKNQEPTDVGTKRSNVEAKVADVCQWLASDNGGRLTGLTEEALASILANLQTAAETVEAGLVAKRTPLKKTA